MKKFFVVSVLLLAPRAASHGADAGKTIEMPDTSDATHGLELSKLKLELLYESDFSKPPKFVRRSVQTKP